MGVKLLGRGTRQPRSRPGPARTDGMVLHRGLKEMWLGSGQMCDNRLNEASPLWMPHYRGELRAAQRKLL